MSRLSKNMPLPGPCIIFILSNQAKSSVDEHTSPNPFIQNVFHFEQENQNFNDLAKDINGFTYWSAREYMEMLGYESYEAFRKAINKAISTCTTLDIDVSENFQQTTIDIAGRPEKDFRLSRFACYLVAMNADPKKLQVAQAQAFFAATAETIRRYVDNAEDVERVLIREEVSTHEKALNSAAKTAGVSDQGFALFQNAGYRGMYNMNLSQLKKHKGLQQANRSLLDFMGKDELAANLFRLTQTELKLKNDQVRGQNNAERVAEDVGKKVRKTMLDISGTKPEDMELADDIKKVRTSLKQTHKGLNQIDG
jgi:DNA-damage-inducible protein D